MLASQAWLAPLLCALASLAQAQTASWQLHRLRTPQAVTVHPPAAGSDPLAQPLLSRIPSVENEGENLGRVRESGMRPQLGGRPGAVLAALQRLPKGQSAALALGLEHSACGACAAALLVAVALQPSLACAPYLAAVLARLWGWSAAKRARNPPAAVRALQVIRCIQRMEIELVLDMPPSANGVACHSQACHQRLQVYTAGYIVVLYMRQIPQLRLPATDAAAEWLGLADLLASSPWCTWLHAVALHLLVIFLGAYLALLRRPARSSSFGRESQSAAAPGSPGRHCEEPAVCGKAKAVRVHLALLLRLLPPAAAGTWLHAFERASEAPELTAIVIACFSIMQVRQTAI